MLDSIIFSIFLQQQIHFYSFSPNLLAPIKTLSIVLTSTYSTLSVSISLRHNQNFHYRSQLDMNRTLIINLSLRVELIPTEWMVRHEWWLLEGCAARLELPRYSHYRRWTLNFIPFPDTQSTSSQVFPTITTIHFVRGQKPPNVNLSHLQPYLRVLSPPSNSQTQITSSHSLSYVLTVGNEIILQTTDLKHCLLPFSITTL